MRFQWEQVHAPEDCDPIDWYNWKWQIRSSLRQLEDFVALFELNADARAEFSEISQRFKIQCSPYYAHLAANDKVDGPIRKIVLPQSQELKSGLQEQEDPLGENKNRPCRRVIHRYSDRALFLVTDFCSVYCRYCTRKHFTGNDQSVVGGKDYQEALDYFKGNPGVREVILSGGDPLTLGDQVLDRILSDLRKIESIEIIRIGTRMPVVCPMRVTDDLVEILKKHNPVYLMTHFNHPKELTIDAVKCLERMVDSGLPVFNQMVLLNGVNNHPAVVQALSRRLLYLRVKPYYAFQCDPSMGTDHLRTSVAQSEQIQKELWGHLSGLAMPNFSVDIPNGGGKAPLAPQFRVGRDDDVDKYRGWDGVEAEYVSPSEDKLTDPVDVENYMDEWQDIKTSLQGEQT